VNISSLIHAQSTFCYGHNIHRCNVKSIAKLFCLTTVTSHLPSARLTLEVTRVCEQTEETSSTFFKYGE